MNNYLPTPTGETDVERGDEGGVVEALPRHLLPHEERLREHDHTRREQVRIAERRATAAVYGPI